MKINTEALAECRRIYGHAYGDHLRPLRRSMPATDGAPTTSEPSKVTAPAAGEERTMRPNRGYRSDD